MKEDYSTIEHDFLHVKDYFSNYKFTYKERKSKLDFLLNINSVPVGDTSSLISSSKQQLVDVKNVYKEIDQELKNLSLDVYKEETLLEDNKKVHKRLCEEEEQLNEEFKKYSVLSEKLELNDRLNQEFDLIDGEIKSIFLEIDNLKSEMNPMKIESKSAEEKQLKDLKCELAAKQKRLTIINTDNYIEDSYYWHKQYEMMLERAFGELNIRSVDDKICIKLQKSENQYIEIMLQDKKIVDASISKHFSEEKIREFEAFKEYSIQINDARLLLSFL